MIRTAIRYGAAFLIVVIGLSSVKSFEGKDSIVNLLFLLLILLVYIPAFNFWYRLLKKL